MRCSLTVLLSNIKSSSVTVTHLFAWNTRTNSVTHTLQGCDCYTRNLRAWIFESCIPPTLITKLNFWTKKFWSMNCGWLKETFWQYATLHGLDKYNTVFQNVKRVLCQNKTHTKISSGWQFCRSISYTFNLFFLLIFLLSFLVNLRIALYQHKDWLIQNRIDRIIITGLIELLWLRWITWKLKLHFV